MSRENLNLNVDRRTVVEMSMFLPAQEGDVAEVVVMLYLPNGRVRTVRIPGHQFEAAPSDTAYKLPTPR